MLCGHTMAKDPNVGVTCKIALRNTWVGLGRTGSCVLHEQDSDSHGRVPTCIDNLGWASQKSSHNAHIRAFSSYKRTASVKIIRAYVVA